MTPEFRKIHNEWNMNYIRKLFALPMIPGSCEKDESFLVWFTLRWKGVMIRAACHPVCEIYESYKIYRMPTSKEIAEEWLSPAIREGFEGIESIEVNPGLPKAVSRKGGVQQNAHPLPSIHQV